MKTYRWGWFTILFLLLLVACAIWIAHGGLVRLKWPWFAVMAILVGMSMYAGCMINGRIDGILIDDRNRISLSRFQWVMWLVILLGGYFVEAVWNAAHFVDFPTMDPRLYVLLGIVSGTAVASNLIVENKKTPGAAREIAHALPGGPAAAPAGAPAVVAGLGPDPVQGAMDVNASPADASWSELFMGEQAANRYVVDISRLQKLIITVLLGIAYLTWLCNDLTDPKAAGMNMPSITDTFVWLLGLSNGAYLAAKAPTKIPSTATPPAE